MTAAEFAMQRCGEVEYGREDLILPLAKGPYMARLPALETTLMCRSIKRKLVVRNAVSNKADDVTGSVDEHKNREYLDALVVPSLSADVFFGVNGIMLASGGFSN